MISPSPDPLHDAWKQDDADHEMEKKCPVCCSCGNRITDGTYLETIYKGMILRFCVDCVTPQYTSEYIRDKEVMQF